MAVGIRGKGSGVAYQPNRDKELLLWRNVKKCECDGYHIWGCPEATITSEVIARRNSLSVQAVEAAAFDTDRVHSVMPSGVKIQRKFVPEVLQLV